MDVLYLWDNILAYKFPGAIAFFYQFIQSNKKNPNWFKYLKTMQNVMQEGEHRRRGVSILFEKPIIPSPFLDVISICKLQGRQVTVPFFFFFFYW